MAIILEKSGEKTRINLEKKAPAGEIIINLKWNDKPKGFFGRIFGGDPVDLDLGCFYELRNGQKTLIDGLQFAHGQGGPRDRQTRQGCYSLPPYIWHTGDDRSASAEGETILVNPSGTKHIKRIIVYTFIYEGATKWAETDATVRVAVPGCEEIVVKMDLQNSNKRFCAIAAINFNDDNTMDVEKLITFHDGHSDCDKAYGWGFSYRTSTK